MTREWKPGDVAMVGGRVCLRMANGMWEHGQASLFAYAGNDNKARPLVVIDPEDRAQIEQLAAKVRAKGFALEYEDRLQQTLREFANPTPPKPEEPQGLGAVVVDRSNEMWVRSRGDVKGLLGVVWENGFSLRHAAWHAIDAVRILSEGVTS